jgi:error-prone DNA polymerase
MVEGDEHHLRLGLRFVRGLRAEAGMAIAEARPFADVDDLARRVPALRRPELEMLASVGALAKLANGHRRDALWKAGRAGRRVGPLLEEVPENAPESPLEPMDTFERIAADYHGTGLTVGRHPMHFRRGEMDGIGVTPARELPQLRNGRPVKVAGCVIVRQRPGTAKGIVFVSLEDETGISNVVVMPDVFEEHRLTIVREPYLIFSGKIQNVDGVIHILAKQVERMETPGPAMS